MSDLSVDLAFISFVLIDFINNSVSGIVNELPSAILIAFNKLALRQSCKLFFTVDGKKYHGYRQRTRREEVNSFRNIITEL